MHYCLHPFLGKESRINPTQMPTFGGGVLLSINKTERIISHATPSDLLLCPSLLCPFVFLLCAKSCYLFLHLHTAARLCFLFTLVAKMILGALCILEAAALLSSLSSHYLYGKAGMEIPIFHESTAALPPSLQLFTPPFPLHHFRAPWIPFSALLPLCCSSTSTSLIVPPTLSCHIVPYSRDLTIERKKKKGFSGEANEMGSGRGGGEKEKIRGNESECS